MIMYNGMLYYNKLVGYFIHKLGGRPNCLLRVPRHLHVHIYIHTCTWVCCIYIHIHECAVFTYMYMGVLCLHTCT